VLGYSGLDGAADLLAARRDLTAAERRIFQGMDSAAALVIDGEVVAAAQQERFTGRKFEHRYPIDAMRWCLRSADVSEDDVDVVAHGFRFGPYERLLTATAAGAAKYHAVLSPARQQELLAGHFPVLASRTRVRGVRHHEAHALSAAVASRFEDCLAVVMDGMGEVDAVSVFRWKNQKLNRLAVQDARSSLGLFYSLITLHLGYEPNSDEYRVMALAAFGDPSRYAHVMRQAVELHQQGRITVPVLWSEARDPYREQYRAGRSWLAEQTFPAVIPGATPGQAQADLAAAAQVRLEQAIVHVTEHWMSVTGLRNVAFAGGVALNCVANAKLLAVGVDRLFVQPAAGDEGTAVGAAFAYAGPTAARPFPPVPLLGPDVGDPEGQRGWRPFKSLTHSVEVAAALLSDGAVVGWARGPLELGPRALGNRSIVADPRDAAARDHVNHAVKFRESFRPLAPAVLKERAAEWFELPSGADLGTMTVTVSVRPSKRSTIPAVTHRDGSARVQVVDRAESPAFWAVLKAFEACTGVPVLINTSLNVKGQPIARTVKEALSTFDCSALDVLFVGDQAIGRGVWDARLRALMRP
jgi:carbamoyltransferase